MYPFPSALFPRKRETRGLVAHSATVDGTPAFLHDGLMDNNKAIENLALEVRSGFASVNAQLASVHEDIKELRSDVVETKERVNDAYTLIDRHMKHHDIDDEVKIISARLSRVEQKVGLSGSL